MLSLFTSKEIRPEVETVDRDPGIVSLLTAFATFVASRSGATARSIRAFNQSVNEAQMFSSSSAWPYNHRAN